MLTKQRFNMILGAPDLWAFSVIIDYTGNESRGAIVRELLRERAREIEREKAEMAQVRLPPVRPPTPSQM